MSDWRVQHGEVIKKFLKYLNDKTDAFILKGGTALAQCYSLDRFSEDIDLDCVNKDIIHFVDEFSKENNFSYRVGKDTTIVKRCFLNYGNESKPLKIEGSYRKRTINDNDKNCINGINVYKIDRLAQMKANAYSARDKIRDLYDVTFICNNYFNQLEEATKNIIMDCLENKGIEQFDYLVETQNDPLINTDKLASDYLNMYDKLGLLYEKQKPKQKVISNIKPNKDNELER